jgi:hypothetical protein
MQNENKEKCPSIMSRGSLAILLLLRYVYIPSRCSLPLISIIPSIPRRHQGVIRNGFSAFLSCCLILLFAFPFRASLLADKLNIDSNQVAFTRDQLFNNGIQL